MSQATETLPNAFIGKSETPTDDDLAAELGRSAKTLWDRLLANLAEQHNVATREWNSYSAKAGWLLRLKRGARRHRVGRALVGTIWAPCSAASPATATAAATACASPPSSI
jgi:hypothetical protein